MPVASDFNSYTHQTMNGCVLGAGEHTTIDGPVTITVQPSARVSAVLTTGEDVPIGVPVVVEVGGQFSVPAGGRGLLTTMDPWSASLRFAWG